MSDTNKQDLVPSGQSEADEEASLDPGSLGSLLVPMEWLAAVAGVAALLAFQVVVKAFENKRHEEVTWPAITENKNVQPLEEEEEEEDEEDEKDEEEEEEEDEGELKVEHYQELEEDDGGEEEEGDDEEDDGGEENEEGAAAAGVYFPEDRVPDAKTKCKVGYYFCDLRVPKPLSILAKEAAEYYYKKHNEVSEETRGEDGEEEGNGSEELEEKPQKDLDSAESSLP
ncbi:uncharacterized protein LOC120889504 [Ictidomys tridecemlineatus]